MAVACLSLVATYAGAGAWADTVAASLSSANVTLEGVAAKDQTGGSLARAGDVNGDGFADVIVGARLADNSRGAAYVLFGGPAMASGSIGATPGFRIDGAAVDDWLGQAVSGLGDLNGDGLSDVVVSAIQSDHAGNNAGAAYVVFGKKDSAAVDAGNLGNGGFRIDGAAGMYLGNWAVGTGDINGDSIPDIAVGGLNDSYVIFGTSNTAPVSVASLGNGGFTIKGSPSVVAAGDVNGDGLSDIGLTSEGRSNYVVFGKSDTSPVNLSDVGMSGFKITGEPDEYASMTGVGDLNKDGLGDLLLGSTVHSVAGRPDSGAAYVVFGKTSTTGVALSSMTAQQGFAIDGVTGDKVGDAVGNPGDVNGDGLPDLLIGASRASHGGASSGSTYLVYGPAGPGTDLADLGDTGKRFDGIQAGDRSGYATAGLGDVNGDGGYDFGVGAPATSSLTSAGFVYFMQGTPKPKTPPTTPPVTPTPPQVQPQTASVVLPKRIRAKGRTKLLKAPVVTSAGQTARAKVTWSTKKSAKGNKAKYAKLIRKAGTVSIQTKGAAKVLYVRISLTAPAQPTYTIYTFEKTWRVKRR